MKKPTSSHPEQTPLLNDHGRHANPGAERAHDILRGQVTGDLQTLFTPRSIALVGASEREGSVGKALADNLAPFQGTVHWINPKHDTLLGAPCHASLLEIPGPVDLAILATPAHTIPALVKQCVEAGVKAAIIISAGFNESGKQGAELQTRTLQEARRGSLRILGPNCLGLMMPRIGLNATFAEGLAEPGHVAFLSQSGALCSSVLDWSYREKVGFSAFVSVGAMMDVGWGDLITHFGDDPETHSIVCYMESVDDARRFLSAAREVALTKPIVILKVGRTDAAAKAAASHTGAMTGSDAVLDAAFRRAGVLRVNSIGEMFDMAETLAKQPRPKGPNLTIVTNAGGAGALATDALVSAGGQISQLWPETIHALHKILPAHWSRGNPVDVLGDAPPSRYGEALEIIAQDPQTDGILAILTPQAMTEPHATAEAVARFARRYHKPLLASWMGGASVDSGRSILNNAHIPTFDYPDRAAQAFAAMWRHSHQLRALYETPASIPECVDLNSAASQAGPKLEAIRATGRTLLTELEAKDILNDYGIPTTSIQHAATEELAVQAARQIGYPVVVKLHSETLTHKSDVGGVRLHLKNDDQVREAWRSIEESVRTKADSRHFQGVTIQPMIHSDGHELILGSSTDPSFGPVLLFGTGGKLTEIFKDTALGLPPLNTTLALRIIEQTRACQALAGARGLPHVDLQRVASILVRFSYLVVHHPIIAEMDINPIWFGERDAVALDARIVLHPASVTPDQLPRPAIRPYPSQYSFRHPLKDGTQTLLRPIRPEDEPLLVEFHHSLSERSLYLRYFTPLKLEQRIAHERLSRLCFIDYDREMALVAERIDPATGHKTIAGIGRMTRLHRRNVAEFALTISDSWQGQGLGSKLLQCLIQIARTEGLDSLQATILADNHEMQHLARKAGFTLQQPSGSMEYQAELALR